MCSIPMFLAGLLFQITFGWSSSDQMYIKLIKIMCLCIPNWNWMLQLFLRSTRKDFSLIYSISLFFCLQVVWVCFHGMNVIHSVHYRRKFCQNESRLKRSNICKSVIWFFISTAHTEHMNCSRSFLWSCKKCLALALLYIPGALNRGMLA